MSEKQSETILGYEVHELKTDMQDLKSDIKDIRECVIKIDKTLTGLPCAVHDLRSSQIEKRVDKLEPQVDKAKGYINRIAGALIVLSLLIQLIAPIALGYVFPGKNDAVSNPPSTTRPTSTASPKDHALNVITNNATGAIQVDKHKP